jgi:cellulose 1,4-beta-cellobiosidase
MKFKSIFLLVLSLVHTSLCIFSSPQYVNPTFKLDIQKTIQSASDPQVIKTLELIKNAPSAFWIDRKEKIYGKETNSLEGILLDASSYSEKQTAIFIFYDLPNRDCNARASNGQLCCTYRADGRCDYLTNRDNCQAGLDQYIKEYVDPYVSVISQYQDKVNIAIVIEPDSLPNLITNMGNPACRNSERVYKDGIKYAVEQFAKKAPKAWVYLDAAHGGWLGWKDSNMIPFVRLVQSMNILPYIRGFATNVANYQPIGKMCPQVDWCLPHNNHLSDECCQDPCKLTTQYNGCVNELNYVQLLASYFPDKKFIIDTGRNGVPNARQDCSNWCNPRDTGLGQYPTTETGYPNIDAFLWLKTPGESDGCSQILPDGKQCPRFDSMCASADSIGSRSGEPRVPEAGGWFNYQIEMYAKNANLGKIPAQPQSSGSPSPSKKPSSKPQPSKKPSSPTQPTPSPIPSPNPSVNPAPNSSPSGSNTEFILNGKWRVKCSECVIDS